MKVIMLNGAMPHYNGGLGKANRIITETLEELGVSVSEVNIPMMQIPVYDGIKADAAEEIVNEIRKSDGVIFTVRVSAFSVGAAMQTFLEHLEYGGFGGALAGKHCMTVVLADGGAREALYHYSGAIQFFGGFDIVRIALESSHLAGDEVAGDIREIIEKQVEDYYRMARQNRRFLTPGLGGARPGGAPWQPVFASPTEAEQPRPGGKGKNITVSEIYEKLHLDEFTERQEEDINELTRLFASKYAEKDESAANGVLPGVLAHEFSPETQSVTPRAKTCHQLTSSLPRYFQPQLAGGLNEVLQLFITGEETVTGYISISNAECDYRDGEAENPDITIIADSSVWMNVLKGKVTAQKAFMIGQLKVRGNFVFLTKFEQLFNRL